MIFVPIWIDKQWTSIAIDTVKKHIRYLDTIYEGGSKILRRIKGWLRKQHDDHSCGVYQLMFKWRIANGRALEAVGSRSIKAAWGMIATAIWKGCLPNEMQHKVHWELPNGRTVAGVNPDNQAEDKSDSQNDTRTERNHAADMEDKRRQETSQEGSN